MAPWITIIFVPVIETSSKYTKSPICTTDSSTDYSQGFYTQFYSLHLRRIEVTTNPKIEIKFRLHIDINSIDEYKNNKSFLKSNIIYCLINSWFEYLAYSLILFFVFSRLWLIETTFFHDLFPSSFWVGFTLL